MQTALVAGAVFMEKNMNERYLKIEEIPAKLFSGEKYERCVLALHGLGGSKESYAIKQLAERLCPRGFAVLAFDWRCHGERKCGFEELTVENCFEDLRAAERWLRENISEDISVFATSFGGYVTLLGTLRGKAPYRRIALRVPAVNMAESLVSCARVSAEEKSARPAENLPDPNAPILEAARKTGFFRVRTGAEYIVPFSVYEEFSDNSCMVEIPALREIPAAVVYAENDELVRRADTEKFLALNPAVKSRMISGCGHRMAESEEKLFEALDFAADFLAE